jgi:hypothetical protein
MAHRPINFPVAEGIGIFVGIVAWDLLAEGRMEIFKALVVTIPCSLVWYGARCWLAQKRNKPNTEQR